MKDHDFAPQEAGVTPWDHVTVRSLTTQDLDRVVAIDARHTGRSRQAYFAAKLKTCLTESGVHLSLAAELEPGRMVGFLLSRVYYGEFGLPEPTAVIDSLGVHPDFTGHQVGTALMEQLKLNLRALCVDRIITQVGWNQPELLGFMNRAGFKLGQQICLELPL